MGKKSTKKKSATRSKPNRSRNKHNMTFDDEVWNAFSEKCKDEGRPISRVLERLMEKYIDGEISWDRE